MHAPIGPYDVLGVIGRGASGTVYRGRHRGLDREAAIKVLQPRDGIQPIDRSRFERELRIAASIAHPCVARVWDGDASGSPAYLAMELIDGVTLAEIADESAPVPWTFALAVLARIAEGLDALHARGLVHRDIKPMNAMLSRGGAVKIVDLGLARAATGTCITDTGVVPGTLLYCSPEQVDGADPAPACDLWAAGATAYRLLTGTPHADGSSLPALLEAIMRQPILPPDRLEPRVHPEASRLVMALLTRDLRRRLGPAAAVAAQAERVLREHGGTSPGEVLTAAACAQLPRLDAPAPSPISSGSGGTRTISMPVVARATAPPADARRGRLRAALPAVATCAILAGLALMAFRPAPRSGESVPPAAPRHGSLFHFYEKFESSQAALAASGSMARKRAAELRRKLPVDLGDEPEVYAWWIVLGRWANAGTGAEPPAPVRPHRDTLDYVDMSVLEHLLARSAGQPSMLLAAGIRSTALYPRDARCWLQLGRELHAQGCVAEARRVTEHGLRLLGDRPLETVSDRTWCGWMQGLLWFRRGQLKEAWLAQVRATVSELPFAAALDVIAAVDPPLFEELLDVTPDRLPQSEHAAIVRARSRMMRGRGREALAIIEAAVNRGGGSAKLLELLVLHRLARGDVTGALTAAKTLPEASLVREDALAAAGAAPPRARWVPGRTDHFTFAREIELSLERGDRAHAEKLAASGRETAWTELVDRTAGARLVASGARGWIAERCRSTLEACLKPGVGPEKLAEILGNLSDGEGVAWASAALDTSTAAPARVALARALLASRSGRLADAIALLERTPADEELSHCLRNLRPWLVELLARAHFGHASGRYPDAGLVKRVLALPVASSHMRAGNDGFAATWRALAAGDGDGALRTAREQFEDSPHSHVWGLIVRWHLGAGADSAAREAWDRRLQVAWNHVPGLVWARREARALEPSR